jgi:Flp pilus assembly protein TadG
MLKRSGSFLRAFARHQEGGVAVVFGLSVVTLLMAAGVALDYARAYSIESSLQSDLDAAVLGAATRLDSPNTLQAAGATYFDENWKAKHHVQSVAVSINKVDDKKVVGTATATVPTTLMQIAGFTTIALNATSEVELGGGHIEVAMVLDVTQSMAGSKLQNLKDAAKLLVEKAYEEPDAAQHVKIGVVPFSQYVNVGLANRNASWMSVPNDDSGTRQRCGTVTPVISSSNCRTETVTVYDDGQPSQVSRNVCDYQYGPPEDRCWDESYNDVWNGCAGSRDNPLDTDDSQYGTPVPGIMNAMCAAPISPLTNDRPTIDAQIDGLTTIGETYIPAGLMWGWTILSKDAPFTEAAGYDEKIDGYPVRKIMVLMTDGNNTISPTYPSHDGRDTTRANQLTADLCTNVKAKSIRVYTVAFDVSDNAIKSILQDCASDSSAYFDAANSSDLADAFRQIASDFRPLRLAR